MKTVQLSCGFKAELDEKVVKDYRFIRLFKKLARAKDDESRVLYFDDILEYIFGNEQAEAIVDYLAETDGYVDSKKIDEALAEAFNILNESDDQDTKK